MVNNPQDRVDHMERFVNAPTGQPVSMRNDLRHGNGVVRQDDPDSITIRCPKKVSCFKCTLFILLLLGVIGTLATFLGIKIHEISQYDQSTINLVT